MADSEARGTQAGHTVEEWEATAERATATAERLIDAIGRISEILSNEKLSEKARVFKARTVLAGLDQ